MALGDTLTWLFLEHFREYDKWPWSRFNSFERQVKEHPSFVCAEILFISLAVISFCHAWGTRDPGCARRLKLTWIATFIVGTVNDYIFMLLPVVDNFWQAQAVIMLTPRMPLYIPCVYNAFMYWPTTAAARVFYHGTRCHLAEACLAGMLAGLFYAPYDVCGARFLWWTWHDSDPGVRLRWLGVPAGSTAWTITFNFSFSLLLRAAADKGWSQLRSLALACLSTLLMMLVLNVFTVLASEKVGMPGPGTALCAITAFGTVALWRLVRPPSGGLEPRKLLGPEPWAVRLAVLAYFAALVAIMVGSSPEAQVSTGAHQEFGPCGVTDVDLMGYPRVRYTCREKYPATYFSLDCPPAAKGATGRWERITPEESARRARGDVASWYTVCGRAGQAQGPYLAAVGALAALGSALFAWALASGAGGAQAKDQ